MKLSLPFELEQFVDREIAAGKFRSIDEAISEALWLLRRREEHRDRLRDEIQTGISQLDEGQFSLVNSDGERDRIIREIEKTGKRG
jgi:putative addiction module CopG family antidote